MAKYASNWGGLTPENKKYIHDKYERFVPLSGKAATVGGEIVRAINRICYRFYNDGDTVARYYGSDYNHSWACDTFLEDHVYGYKTMKYLSEDAFEDALAENFNLIAEYLKAHENLFEEPNDTDCIEDAPLMKYEDEYDDDYDYEDEWGDDEE